MKIKEAIQIAKMNGKKDITTTLSKQMWPSAKPTSQKNQMSNLIKRLRENPDTKIPASWVNLISKETGVTPNQLFGKEPIEL